MGALSTFFGDAVGSGSSSSGVALDSPKKLPFYRSCRHTYLKYSATAYRHVNNDQFWNSIRQDNPGDYTYHTMTATDTWENHVNYTGAGRYYGFIAPNIRGTGSESWVKITVDGSAYTFKAQMVTRGASFDSTNQYASGANTDGNFLQGYFTALPNTNSTSSYNVGPNDYHEYGYEDYNSEVNKSLRPDKYGVPETSDYQGYITFGSKIKHNVPYVKFESSLRVDFYCTNNEATVSTTANHNKGIAFWMKEPTVLEG